MCRLSRQAHWFPKAEIAFYPPQWILPLRLELQRVLEISLETYIYTYLHQVHNLMSYVHLRPIRLNDCRFQQRGEEQGFLLFVAK
jgi:hypothetical protein